MLRTLAVLRRAFLGGVVSLILCLLLLNIKGEYMLNIAVAHNSIPGVFSIYFLVSPIIYLLLTLISVAYIRKNGQFAAIHQSQSPITTFFKCVGSDLASPFKNLKNFFVSLFSKNVSGREIIIRRFIGMIILIVVCVIGIGFLLQ